MFIPFISLRTLCPLRLGVFALSYFGGAHFFSLRLIGGHFHVAREYKAAIQSPGTQNLGRLVWTDQSGMEPMQEVLAA